MPSTAMDFAVDQIPLAQPSQPASLSRHSPRPTEVLLAGKAVRLESAKPTQEASRSHRFAIFTKKTAACWSDTPFGIGATHVYDVDTPQVYALTGARYPQSLYPPGGLATGGPGSMRARQRSSRLQFQCSKVTCSLRILHLVKNPLAS